MKKSLFPVIALVCLFSFAGAQSPSSIPYQAVARDASGNLLVNKKICVQFGIYSAQSGGTLLYEEHDTVTTNSLGLFTLSLGQGSYDGGSYTSLGSLNWGSTGSYVAIGLDLTGNCSGYVPMGIRTQMLSVPYALYAGNAAAATVTASSPLSGNGTSASPLGIGQATSSTSGYLSSSDWTTFNNKLTTVSISSPLSGSGTSGSPLAVGYDNSTIKVSGGNLYAVNTGTVTSVATTSPITGGPFSGSGAIACPTCVTTGTVSALGNPTAKVELTASGGSGTTAMYANATLALDQSIAPTWTGTHTFSSTNTYSALFTGGNVGIGTATPGYKLQVVDNVDNGNTVVVSSSTNNAELVLDNTQTGGHFWSLGSTGGSAAVPSVFRIYNETTESTDVLTITGAGLVGIGTNTPSYPLDIELDPTDNVPDGGNYGYLNSSGGEGHWTGNPISSIPVSLYSLGRIIVNGEVDVISDQRIKDIKGQSSSFSDLQTLNKIQVTDYAYKDKIKFGPNERKGFIAQQVESVFPQAVSPNNTGFIPGIYTLAECADFNAGEHTLTITLNKPHNLVKGDKVRLIGDLNEKKDMSVAEIISDTEFKVEGCDKPMDKVFVFGKQVHDLHVVDYDRIYTLNVSATQELAKQLNEANHAIEQLKNENTMLKESKADAGDVNQLKAQLDEKSAEINKLNSRLDQLKNLMELNGIRSEK